MKNSKEKDCGGKNQKGHVKNSKEKDCGENCNQKGHEEKTVRKKTVEENSKEKDSGKK